MNKYKLAIFLILLLSNGVYFAQDKKLDKIEMLYDQGHYSKALRKIDKLQNDPLYDNNASLQGLYVLSLHGAQNAKEKTNWNEILTEYGKFQQLDSNDYYMEVYANYLYFLQQDLSDDLQELKENDAKKYKELLSLYQQYFGNYSPKESVKVESPKELDDAIPLREALIKESKKHIGTPYLYGGNTTKGFDFSGYTSYVFAKNGISLPRTAQAQSDKYVEIKKSKAKPGDLVFFGTSKSAIQHVGIIVSVENEKLTMIHASSSKGIIITQIDNDPYWSKKVQKICTVLES